MIALAIPSTGSIAMESCGNDPLVTAALEMVSTPIIDPLEEFAQKAPMRISEFDVPRATSPVKMFDPVVPHKEGTDARSLGDALRAAIDADVSESSP